MGPSGEGTPRRVLVVSADMGGGHHATGRALEEDVERHWPGSEVRWVDTLDTMGHWVGPLFRRIYVANVRTTPWLYEFFYSTLWRHRWFASASKGFVAGWSGRRLAGEVERFDPDLILSTYPLGSAGLAWLRRNRMLPVPVGAWVSDFAPHPFWLYRDLDTTYLMHPAALPMAELAEPGIRARATVPTVESRFHPGDPLVERKTLGLSTDRFVVLVSCGAYGFGAVTEAVDALLAVGDRVQVVVACARNEQLRADLAARDLPAERLVPLGWTPDMAGLTRAADLVVTNAGGATALEALASGRPVVMYRPIAAHGAANAALMALSGLAETCSRPAALTALVSAMATDTAPGVRVPGDTAPDLAALGDAASGDAAPAGDTGAGAIDAYLRGHDAHTDLPALARRTPPAAPPAGDAARIAPVRRAWPLRPPDSFFLHVQTRAITQQVGAVITAEPEPGAVPLGAGVLAERIEAALPVLTTLRRRLVPRGDWRRPGWVADPTVRPADHVTEVDAADETERQAVLDRFWSQPVSLRRPPWQLLVLHTAGTDRCTLAFKMHHAIGDGLSLIGTLDRLLETPGAPTHRRRGTARRPAPTLRGIAFHTRRVVRGMWELGTSAGAPRHPFNRDLTPNRRGIVTVPLPTDDVRAAARAHHVRSSEVLLGVVAEALHRAGVAGAPDTPTRLRTMLPVAMASADGGRTAGNRTGVVSVDLPVGPMGVADRIHTIRGDLHRRMNQGEPHAAAFVMRALGMFPAPVHGWMARRVYNAQFFNMIASYIPGPLRQRRLAGHRLTEVYPVVALAEGVPLGVGIMRYAGVTGLCVLYDDSLRAFAEPLADAVRSAFADAAVPPRAG
ncbi:MAG TPA: WS/DGAT domain-containing protein [Actinocatenispora sp.]